ncbi:Uncharacterised protein [Mycobacteroides abscessus subsp. abscessus]|nr:Uncharacterised protein [Mycobacteroides abscessus subsp. abscessus]
MYLAIAFPRIVDVSVRERVRVIAGVLLDVINQGVILGNTDVPGFVQVVVESLFHSFFSSEAHAA